jgi:hypothetical protein
VLLGLSFLSVGDQKSEPGFAPPLRAMAQVPLSTLAPVLKLTPAELRERLGASGVLATSDTQTLAELVGPDLKRQIGVLNGLLAAPRP